MIVGGTKGVLLWQLAANVYYYCLNNFASSFLAFMHLINTASKSVHYKITNAGLFCHTHTIGFHEFSSLIIFNMQIMGIQ